MALQMRQNLNLRMEQKLKLTPQMIQSIEILLLPQMALEERIMNEIESNPVLEMLDGGNEMGDNDTRSTPAAEGEAGDGSFEAGGSGDVAVVDRFREEDQDWLWRSRLTRNANNDDRPDKMEALASAPDKPPSLA